MLELEPEIQQALQDRTITEGHARALLMIPAGAFRVDVFTKMVNTKMSVRQIEQLADRLLKGTQRKEKPTHPQLPDVFYFEQDLQETLGTKVEVKYGKNPSKGTLVIHYHSVEQLNNIASRLKNKML